MEGLFCFPAQNHLKIQVPERISIYTCSNIIIRLMHGVDVKHSPVIPSFFLSFAFSNWLSNVSALIGRHIVGFYLA